MRYKNFSGLSLGFLAAAIALFLLVLFSFVFMKYEHAVPTSTILIALFVALKTWFDVHDKERERLKKEEEGKEVIVAEPVIESKPFHQSSSFCISIYNPTKTTIHIRHVTLFYRLQSDFETLQLITNWGVKSQGFIGVENYDKTCEIEQKKRHFSLYATDLTD